MRAAALEVSIEELIIWHAESPGDFFYMLSNTVHAIGAGGSLIEVHPTSDISYRLYDYGSPRELYLEDRMAVSRSKPYALGCWHRRVAEGSSRTLVDWPLFLLDQVDGIPFPEVTERDPGPLLVIPRKGGVEAAGKAISPGAAGWPNA